MAKCLKCGTTEAIVHSGTDAFLMGVITQVERICYDCANLTINKDVVEETPNGL
jgi:hypothetical protein